MSLTLAQVAARCGVDKSTARRWVKTGLISGTRDDAGTWFVEECELLRVRPDAAASPTEPASAAKLHAPGDATLEAVQRASDALVAELRAVIADMRQERDHWRGVAERLTLAPPPAKPTAVPTVTVVTRRGWWPWRRSA